MRTTLWAAALVAGLAYSLSATAADFGGNCCADLEERVAELEATTARKGNRKVSLTIYGQVNAGILWADADAKDREFLNYSYVDGNDDTQSDSLSSDWASVSANDKRIFDNGTSESRFGFKGEAKINESLKAGFVIEIGVGEPKGERDIAVRHAAWFLESAQLGRITVGKTSQATDDIDTISVANISAAVKMLSVQPASSAYLGGMDFAFDGGKRNVARYDSPSIGGFVVSASWGDEDTWDVALRYAGEFGQVRVAGGVGYRHEVGSILGADKDQEAWLANGGVMHIPSGIFIQGAYGDIDTGETSTFGLQPGWVGPDYSIGMKGWHVLGGIEQKAFSIGKTTVFAEYADLDADRGRSYGDCFGEDLVCYTDQRGDLKWWGVGIVQSIDAAAMDLYATFRQYDGSASETYGATWDDGFVNFGAEGKIDAKVFQAGARIRF